MKILVIGAGGREHALVWKIKQSPKVSKIYAAPGNAGIAALAECIPIKDTDLQGLLNFARENKIDLTVVGPEAVLVTGIVDEFEKAGLKIFGPAKAASILEGSKAFTKNLLSKYKIPTAQGRVFSNLGEAQEYIGQQKFPLVVKADGLAAGKGVMIVLTPAAAREALEKIMKKKEFGEAGKKVVVEEFLEGQEASILCFTDGKTILPLASAQDHKAVFDGDRGPNTGGMGAYSPAPIVTSKLMDQIQKKILEPTLEGLKKEGIKYKGVLYAGLMITKDGPKVLEYNCRFGDPETQPLLVRLETDLVDVMLAVCDENLSEISLKWRDEASVCVVLASGGYPGAYKKGLEVKGLDEVSKLKDVICFQAGTSLKDDKVVTSGGRVLGITASGKDIKTAIANAYQAVNLISFEGMQFRKDIGLKALVK